MRYPAPALKSLAMAVQVSLAAAAHLSLAAAAHLSLAAAVHVSLTAAAGGADLRASERIGDGWMFALARTASDADAMPADGWGAVRLPHTWNAIDGQDGGNDYFRGAGWYRFDGVLLRADRASGDCILGFGAASIVADVWLDGQFIGQHHGAFAAFAFDITRFVRRGESQRLLVRVDNRRFDDIPPRSGDFTMFGGLYREVSLEVRPTTRFEFENPAAAPLRVSTQSVSEARAVINVAADVRGRRSNTRIRTTAYSPGGRTVFESEKAWPSSGEVLEARFQIEIERPELWDGVRSPNLYRLTLELLDDDRLVDRVETQFGIRTYRVDPTHGFILNGKPYDLHGVSRHQDRLDKGWAISRKDIEEDFAILRELGCSGVRLAHYPHDDYAYTLADQSGLVAWAEIPLVDQVGADESFACETRAQLREMIEQHFNHPSICFWGIHNEVTAPWKPGPDPTPLVAELNALAKSMDSSRLTVSAACDPADHRANWQTDLTAFNRYFGWYLGTAADFGPWCDHTHAMHEATPLGISEYGAGGSEKLRQWPATMPVHNGPVHPEQWQTEVHRETWAAMRDRPYLWCKFVWNGFDFASDARREGDLPGRNDKGLVTFDRKRRKEAFHWYRVAWSEAPAVHVAMPIRRSDSGAVVVRVFSNCERVELFVDGRSAGERTVEGGVAVWESVTGDAEMLSARAQCGDEVVTDERRPADPESGGP